MKSASGSNKLTAVEIFQMRFSNSNLNFRAPLLILLSVNQYTGWVLSAVTTFSESDFS